MPRLEYIEKLHQSKIVLNTSPDNLIGPRFYETRHQKLSVWLSKMK